MSKAFKCNLCDCFFENNPDQKVHFFIAVSWSGKNENPDLSNALDFCESCADLYWQGYRFLRYLAWARSYGKEISDKMYRKQLRSFFKLYRTIVRPKEAMLNDGKK